MEFISEGILENIQKWRFWFWHFWKRSNFEGFSGLAPSKRKIYHKKNMGRLCVFQGTVYTTFHLWVGKIAHHKTHLQCCFCKIRRCFRKSSSFVNFPTNVYNCSRSLLPRRFGGKNLKWEFSIKTSANIWKQVFIFFILRIY